MTQPPTWSLALADLVRYVQSRRWIPSRVASPATEPFPRRVARLKSAWQASRLSRIEDGEQDNLRIYNAALSVSSRGRDPAEHILFALWSLGLQLMHDNHYVCHFPLIDLSRSMSMEEIVHHADVLTDLQLRIENDARLQHRFGECLCTLFLDLLETLPDQAFDQHGAFRTSLYDAMDARHLVTGVLSRLLSSFVPAAPDPIESLVLRETRNTLWNNLLDASELTAEQFEKRPHGLVFPQDSDLPPSQLAATYFAGTPFAEFTQIYLPFSIPQAVRNEHVLLVARTGSGKTQLIQNDIFHNLQLDDSPGMIVIDSQNQMIPKLERMRLARDRIVIVDPFDASPPALNMFAPSPRTIDDPNVREVVEAKTLEQFAWIFSALDQELTGRQTTLFAFTARILLAMSANIQSMLDILQIEKLAQLKESIYWPFIAEADTQTQYFFEHRFCTADYNRTKSGVADRLLGVLRIPAFTRMFMAPANKLDLYAELAQRKLVVFNTQKSRLGADASAILGRYAISLYVRAAFERELDRSPPPAFLYVDEASEYFGRSDSSDVLFTQLRKYNCGTFVAFQDLSQLGDQLHSIMTSTTTKLTGGVSVSDAKKLAPDMRTTPEQLLSIEKRSGAFEMMCYIANTTPRAVKLSFPYGAVETAPILSESEYNALKKANRAHLSVPISSQGDASKQNQSKPQPKPDARQKPAHNEPSPSATDPAENDSRTPPPAFDIKPGKEW